MTHTPGPWTFRPDPDAKMRATCAYWIDGAPTYDNATIGSPIADVRNLGAPSEANARLIAAAPEMLEALEQAAMDYGELQAYMRAAKEPEAQINVVKKRLAACLELIAKAEGREG